MSQQLAHIVYFTLVDDSAASAAGLIAECQEWLQGHPGCVYFSVGTRATVYQRPVNDQAFHVALHTVFASQADHDAYQTSERHQQFLARNKEHWAAVRVFDSLVQPAQS